MQNWTPKNFKYISYCHVTTHLYMGAETKLQQGQFVDMDETILFRITEF